MGTIRAFGAAIAIFVVCPGALASDNSKNLAPDFTNLPEHSKIVVAPPDIELFEISAGGVTEPRADWTDAARKWMRAEIEQRRGGLGVGTVELDEATADEFGELLSLHAAIAQSIARAMSATSISFLPDECAGFDCEQCATDTTPITNTTATAAGDSRKLRGIPALAHGVGSTIPGTDPLRALLAKERKAEAA